MARRNAGGRTTKYEASVHVPWGASLAKRGCTLAEIAEAFGVSERTVYNWQKTHPEFFQTLKENKSKADEQIVEALFHRALGGCRVSEVKEITTYAEDGNTVIGKTVTKHQKELPPDVTACIYWLKNRQPQLWRDNPNEARQAANHADMREWIEALGL